MTIKKNTTPVTTETPATATLVIPASVSEWLENSKADFKKVDFLAIAPIDVPAWDSAALAKLGYPVFNPSNVHIPFCVTPKNGVDVAITIRQFWAAKKAWQTMRNGSVKTKYSDRLA